MLAFFCFNQFVRFIEFHYMVRYPWYKRNEDNFSCLALWILINIMDNLNITYGGNYGSKLTITWIGFMIRVFLRS
ncbi:hypothetical protein C171_30269 [Paenibacillus sp. FSL H8-237]|nr:hypothetical protein C171_30269 [Paenibacillus sp. FSL H8-237]